MGTRQMRRKNLATDKKINEVNCENMIQNKSVKQYLGTMIFQFQYFSRKI